MGIVPRIKCHKRFGWGLQTKWHQEIVNYKSIPKTLNTPYYFSVVGTLPLDFCLYWVHQWLLILTIWCLEIYLHHLRLIPGLDTWLNNPVGSFGGWLIKRRKGRLQFYILDEFCNVPDTPTFFIADFVHIHAPNSSSQKKCCLHVSWYEAMVNLAGATMSNTSNLLSVENSHGLNFGLDPDYAYTILFNNTKLNGSIVRERRYSSIM